MNNYHRKKVAADPTPTNESEIQRRIITWATSMAEIYPELKWLHAIPNGGSRGSTKEEAARVGAIMKLEGVKSGVSDLMLPVARCGANGLYIEMKTEAKGSKLSDSQTEFLQFVMEQGYAGFVCRNVVEATGVIQSYLENMLTQSDADQCRAINNY